MEHSAVTSLRGEPERTGRYRPSTPYASLRGPPLALRPLRGDCRQRPVREFLVAGRSENGPLSLNRTDFGRARGGAPLSRSTGFGDRGRLLVPVAPGAPWVKVAVAMTVPTIQRISRVSRLASLRAHAGDIGRQVGCRGWRSSARTTTASTRPPARWSRHRARRARLVVSFHRLGRPHLASRPRLRLGRLLRCSHHLPEAGHLPTTLNLRFRRAPPGRGGSPEQGLSSPPQQVHAGRCSPRTSATSQPTFGRPHRSPSRRRRHRPDSVLSMRLETRSGSLIPRLFHTRRGPGLPSGSVIRCR